MTKDKIIKMVNSAGKLKFSRWYKNVIYFTNEKYTVGIKPDYRDYIRQEETLDSLMINEDYEHINVFDGIKEGPLPSLFYKEGDN